MTAPGRGGRGPARPALGRLVDRFRDLPRAAQLTLLIAPLLLLAAAYYAILWGSVAAFVVAVDHHGRLFADFTGHYYPMARTILQAHEPVLGYIYSAFFALLLHPIGALDPPAALAAWGVLQGLALLALCLVPLLGLLRLPPLGIAAYVAVYLTSFPLLHNTKWGQVSVLLAAVVIGAFLAASRGRRILAGALLALAAAIKYYPALFLLPFLLKREWRVGLSFLATLLVLYALVPVLLLGPGRWMAFEQSVLASSLDAPWMRADVNSQYFAHVASRWITMALGGTVGPAGERALGLAGLAIFLGQLGVLLRLQRGRMLDAPALSLALLFLSLPFVLKSSWPHYFACLPFCQVAVLRHLLARGDRGAPGASLPAAAGHASSSGTQSGPFAAAPGRILLAMLALLSIACSSVFAFNSFSHWSGYSGAGMLLLANLLLLACIDALVLAPRSRARAVA